MSYFIYDMKEQLQEDIIWVREKYTLLQIAHVIYLMN